VAERKIGEFSDELVALADLAKALSHPGRLEILRILAGKACICGDIVEQMPLSQATVSQHLKELKNAGLIRGEVAGPRICYCLDTDALAKARDRFNTLFADVACCSEEGVCSEKSG
jgi:ArsR family transcriptional regulator